MDRVGLKRLINANKKEREIWVLISYCSKKREKGGKGKEIERNALIREHTNTCGS